MPSLSDTAHWVALHRAWESERPDALFVDPFARPLAGERAEQLVAEFPGCRVSAWFTATRTCVFDDMILERVSSGCDAVLNVGAGLDSRPYRLDLPPELPWVEVDSADVLGWKEHTMQRVTPRCRRITVACDLSKDSIEPALAALGDEPQRVLVVSEGLLMYLPPDSVARIAHRLRDFPTASDWILDSFSPAFVQYVEGDRFPFDGGVAYPFAPDDPAGYFAAHGWRCVESRSALSEAERLHRAPPLAWLTLGPDPRSAMALHRLVRVEPESRGEGRPDPDVP